MDRHRERTLQQELLAGIISATLANHSFQPPKPMAAPAHFMPSQWDKRVAKKQRAASDRQELANRVRILLNARIQAQQANANQN